VTEKCDEKGGSLVAFLMLCRRQCLLSAAPMAWLAVSGRFVCTESVLQPDFGDAGVKPVGSTAAGTADSGCCAWAKAGVRSSAITIAMKVSFFCVSGITGCFSNPGWSLRARGRAS
jgi:hypothetical protein